MLSDCQIPSKELLRGVTSTEAAKRSPFDRPPANFVLCVTLLVPSQFIFSCLPATLFACVLAMLTFANDKRFGLVDMGQKRLKSTLQ